MTKAAFICWLQELVDRMIAAGEVQSDAGEYDLGDVWRRIESEDLLGAIGVSCAVDRAEHHFLFRCADGLLASGYEVRVEGETIWWFDECQVARNMRDATNAEVDAALGRARADVLDLEALLAP